MPMSAADCGFKKKKNNKSGITPGMYVQVFVNSRCSQAKHLLYDDARPVLAARYEPSMRILALLLLSSPGDFESATVVFLAFTPDYKRLQMCQKLKVTLVSENLTVGPEGVPTFVGQLPFVLLPAVADREGAGTTDKVSMCRKACGCMCPGMLWSPVCA